MRQNATVLLTLLAALVCAPSAGAQDDVGLLREHAPRLVYDARDADQATAVEALVAGPVRGAAVALRPRVTPLPDVAYGRVVRAGGATFLQYWLLYADNPQDRGIVRTGRHAGDWELVQLRLGADGRPAVATYAQHGWAARCGWSGDVFVANGSHASYPRAGEHGRPWPDPDDEARGDGRAVTPDVRPFGAWVRWPGRWGTTETGALPVPGESPSPRGPAFQETAAWRDPAAYERGARACADGAPPHPWPVYAVPSALLLLLLLGVRTWRAETRSLRDRGSSRRMFGRLRRMIHCRLGIVPGRCRIPCREAGDRGTHVVGVNRLLLRAERRLFPR